MKYLWQTNRAQFQENKWSEFFPTIFFINFIYSAEVYISNKASQSSHLL